MRLAVVGVPYGSSGRPGGEADAPAALRRAGLVDALRLDHDVSDAGDVPLPPPTAGRDPVSGVVDPASLAAVVAGTGGMVRAALADGRLPLVVGGECPLLLGCLDAARAELGDNLGLLFVDGHEDAYPPHASLTGEAADMALGLALGVTHLDGLAEVSGRLPLVAPADAIVLGARDRGDIERDGVARLTDRVVVLDDAAVRERGGSVAADWVTGVERRGLRFWLHLDLDALSSGALPAVRYRQPGGLGWGDLEAVARAAVGSPALAGIDVTIYNPDLDQGGDGAAAIVASLGRVLTA